MNENEATFQEEQAAEALQKLLDNGVPPLRDGSYLLICKGCSVGEPADTEYRQEIVEKIVTRSRGTCAPIQASWIRFITPPKET